MLTLRTWHRHYGGHLLLGGLALDLVLSVLCVGSVHPIWVLIYGGLSLLLGALAVTRAPRRSGALGPALLCFFLGAFSAAQAAPLPLHWVDVLSPASAATWRGAMVPFGEVLTTASVSLDPGASLLEALKWCAYGAVILAASEVARERGAEAPLGLVFGSSVLLALVTLAHSLAGATTVFGLYTPLYPIPPSHIGPLLNVNNLAGYLNLGAMVGAGLLAARAPVVPRSVLAVGVLIVGAVSFRTASRGGVLTLLLMTLAFAFVRWLQNRKRGADREVAPRRLVMAFTAVLVLAAGFSVSSADDVFWSELLSDNAIKLQLPKWVRPMIAEHPWFGVGRGAFASVFQAYRPSDGQHLVFAYPENFLVQWITEWGVPLGASALAAFVWMFRPWRVGFGRSSVLVGAYLGAFGLLLQNLVDLGTEVFSIGIAFATVLGTLQGDHRRRGVRASGPLSERLRTALVGLALLPLLLMVRAGVMLQSVDADRFAVSHALESADADPAAFRAVLLAATRRHPADHYFPLAGGISAVQKREGPMPWIDRALSRGPTVGRVHLLLADVLRARGVGHQALLELKLAAQYEPGLAFVTSRTALRMTRDEAKLLQIVPEGEPGREVLDRLATSIPMGTTFEDARLREAIDRAHLARFPESDAPRLRMIDARLRELGTDRPPCEDRTICEEELVSLADGISSRISTRPARVRARIFMADGFYEEAERVLSCEGSERAECLADRAVIESELGMTEPLDATIAAWIATGCSRASTCADTHTQVADLRMARREPSQALLELEAAAKAEPTEERWLRVASFAQQSNAKRAELRALERVKALRRGAPTGDVDLRLEVLRQEERIGL